MIAMLSLGVGVQKSTGLNKDELLKVLLVNVIRKNRLLSLMLNHIPFLCLLESYKRFFCTFLRNSRWLKPMFNFQGTTNLIPGQTPQVIRQLTTVFVGNITDKASDTIIRQILMVCLYFSIRFPSIHLKTSFSFSVM